MSNSIQLTSHPTAFIAADVRIELKPGSSAGTITNAVTAVSIGPNCVLHPRSTILVASGASLSLGTGCVIEENAVVVAGNGSMTIGDQNWFMVGSRIELPDIDAGGMDVDDAGTNSSSTSPLAAIGSWNTFGPRSVCMGVRIGDECTVGAGTTLLSTHPLFHAASSTALTHTPILASRTVIYGASSSARTWDGSGSAQERSLRLSANEYLREVMPKSNKARMRV